MTIATGFVKKNPWSRLRALRRVHALDTGKADVFLVHEVK